MVKSVNISSRHVSKGTELKYNFDIFMRPRVKGWKIMKLYPQVVVCYWWWAASDQEGIGWRRVGWGRGEEYNTGDGGHKKSQGAAIIPQSGGVDDWMYVCIFMLLFSRNSVTYKTLPNGPGGAVRYFKVKSKASSKIHTKLQRQNLDKHSA